MALTIEEKKQDKVVILFLAGVLDSCNKEHLQERLKKLVQSEKIPRVVLDLAALEYISSVGWGIFVEFNMQMKEKDGGLKLLNMRDKLDRLYSLMGIGSQLEAYREINEAIRSFY